MKAYNDPFISINYTPATPDCINRYGSGTLIVINPGSLSISGVNFAYNGTTAMSGLVAAYCFPSTSTRWTLVPG